MLTFFDSISFDSSCCKGNKGKEEGLVLLFSTVSFVFGSKSVVLVVVSMTVVAPPTVVSSNFARLEAGAGPIE